jgi:tetratricopeptide (TPR) repeat protein
VELTRIAVAQLIKQQEVDKALALIAATPGSEPENAESWHELAGHAVLHRRWETAAQALEKAVKGKPDKAEWSRDRAFVYAAWGKWEDYRRVCRETLENFGSKESWWDRIEVPYTFSQGDNPPSVLNEALRVGENLLKEREDSNCRFRYGVALYRAGKWQEALDSLKIAQGENDNGYQPRRCDPVIAMVLYRLGKVEEARAVLAKHRKWLEETTAKKPKTPFVPALEKWWDSLALENIEREAEALVGGTTKSS